MLRAVRTPGGDIGTRGAKAGPAGSGLKPWGDTSFYLASSLYPPPKAILAQGRTSRDLVVRAEYAAAIAQIRTNSLAVAAHLLGASGSRHELSSSANVLLDDRIADALASEAEALGPHTPPGYVAVGPDWVLNLAHAVSFAEGAIRHRHYPAPMNLEQWMAYLERRLTPATVADHPEAPKLRAEVLARLHKRLRVWALETVAASDPHGAPQRRPASVKTPALPIHYMKYGTHST